jgi:hypothetical protein
MKKIFKDKIINIDKNLFDNKFLFEYFPSNSGQIFLENWVEIIYIEDLLKQKINKPLFNNLWDKYAMYSNVYSPEDELEIFKNLFNDAIKNTKRIHIIWVSLKEEIEILEEYYQKLWFLRDDINCFLLDFNIPLVTVSVKIENLIWKWSDYKAQKKKIFFIPPIRESGQNKAMFKWINRWVIAWIHINKFDEKVENFLGECLIWEKILSINLAKVLLYNLEDIGFKWEKKELIIEY